MIGDKLEVNGKHYTIKKDLSFGEYKKISKIGNKLQDLSKEYESASEERKEEITNEFSKSIDEQLVVIADFLENILDVKDSELNKLSISDVISLFNEAFIVSTQVKKKPEKILN